MFWLQNFDPSLQYCRLDSSIYGQLLLYPALRQTHSTTLQILLLPTETPSNLQAMQMGITKIFAQDGLLWMQCSKKSHHNLCIWRCYFRRFLRTVSSKSSHFPTNVPHFLPWCIITEEIRHLESFFFIQRHVVCERRKNLHLLYIAWQFAGHSVMLDFSCAQVKGKRRRSKSV